jgi:phosphatidate cytidylyltransferase
MVPIFLVVALGTVWEMAVLLKRRWPISPRRVVAVACLGLSIGLMPLWISLANAAPYADDAPLGRVGWIAIGLLAAALVTSLLAIRDFSRLQAQVGLPDAESATLAWGLGLAILLYGLGPLMMFWPVRLHGSSWEGMAHLVGIILMTKMADAGAYFAGKSFGKTKLSPMISPGKTVEGLLGGIAASILSAYIWYRLVFPALDLPAGGTLWGPGLLASLLTIGGLAGDLTESMVKRTVGAKDSSGQIPGLGGVWDVTDSLLPATVLGYLGILAGWT